MKKIFIAAAMALTVISSVNASGVSTASKKISYKLNEAFNQEFAGAENVTWSAASNNMMRANFTNDGENVNAFFSEDGEFVASTIVLTADKLPSKLKKAIDKKFENVIIIETVELQNAQEHAYFVKVNINGTDKLLKGYTSGSVSEVTLNSLF
jgi:hypothetical protein